MTDQFKKHVFIQSVTYEVRVMSDEAKNDFMNRILNQTIIAPKSLGEQKIAYISREAKVIKHLSVRHNLMLAHQKSLDEKDFEQQYGKMLSEINYPAIKDLLPNQLTEKQLLMLELALQVIRETNFLIFDMDTPKTHMIFQDKSVSTFINKRFKESVKVTLHQHDFTMLKDSVKLNFSQDGLDYE